MQLSNYSPGSPPEYFKTILTELVLEQQYRYLKVQKPGKLNNMPLSRPESTYAPFERAVNANLSPLLKKKIIQKIKSQQIDIKAQKKAQRLLNVHLLNRLHLSTLEAIKNKAPPPFLSVLDTKEEGDYLSDGEKKEYPHFSNIILPAAIPKLGESNYIRKVIKQSRPVFDIEEKVIFKVKHLYRFPKLLLRLGNQEFDLIAEEISCSQSNAKLLYDLFNDYFDIEDAFELKTQEQKSAYLHEVRNFMTDSFARKRTSEGFSLYVPAEEEFLSLREVRECFNKKKQQSEPSLEG